MKKILLIIFIVFTSIMSGSYLYEKVTEPKCELTLVDIFVRDDELGTQTIKTHVYICEIE